MSLRDQMPFFNDPPSWYFRVVAALLGTGAVIFFLCLAFIVFWGREYWPILLFGPIIFFASMAARGFWQRARMKENQGFKQEPTNDV
jgi:hypothetical protein